MIVQPPVCTVGHEQLQTDFVGTEPWQMRAKRAGLSQKELARLLGMSQNAVSDALRGRNREGVPTYMMTIIRLWEVADRKEREAILAEPRRPPDA